MGLIIAGSDKRGTIYGIYDLSEQMGVFSLVLVGGRSCSSQGRSVREGRQVHTRTSRRQVSRSLLERRGSLTVWNGRTRSLETSTNQMYERVFELLLRLKANYLWPAMWNNAFNEMIR